MPKQSHTQTTAPDENPLPLWAERDVAFKKLSPTQQAELRQIVCPLYQRFVLDPHDPLERSCGVSIIHLIWSELLKQCELASLSYSNPDYSETRRGQHFSELFALLNAKCQLSSLLILLRQHPLTPLTSSEPNSALFPLDAALLTTNIPEYNA